jgi:hypothetical protein
VLQAPRTGIGMAFEGHSMKELSWFLASVDHRLERRGLRTARRIDLSGVLTADLVGSRTYFSWKGLVLLSEHVVVRSAEAGAPADLDDLFAAGFRYAKQVNRVPLLRGMQFGYLIIPCLVVNEANEGLVHAAESRPHKRWSLFELPVVVDLRTKSAGSWGQLCEGYSRLLLPSGQRRRLTRCASNCSTRFAS